MSKVLKMKSVPILNATDFYKHFDVLDILGQCEACVRFALGHLNWGRSLNLHHIGVIESCLKPDMKFSMTDAEDYWEFEEKLSKDECSKFDGFKFQSEVAKKIFEKYEKDFPGDERRILMLLIAAVLLGDKTETCTESISAAGIKAACRKDKKRAVQFDADEGKTAVTELSFKGTSFKISLPYFKGCFRVPFNPKLRPSYENRYQTWTIQATTEATVELFDVNSARTVKYKLESGGKIFCLVLNEAVVKVLANVVENGDNTLIRKTDGIYLNDNNCPIPAEASSFAIGDDTYSPWILYVRDGHVHHICADGIGFRQRVSEQVNVIAEVYVKNGKAVIVRNDGMVWNGERFVQGGITE